MSQLPRFIRDVRHSLGLTQKQFAEAVGVNSMWVVSDWERDKYVPMRKNRETIGALANEHFRREREGIGWPYRSILEFTRKKRNSASPANSARSTSKACQPASARYSSQSKADAMSVSA